MIPSIETYAFPASFAQQRLWFLDQLTPGQALYNMPAALRLRGVLHTAALMQALQEIVRRHETLRTTFRLQEEELMQVVKSARHHDLPLFDLTALPATEREERMWEAVRAAACQPFDLSQGPLFCTSLYKLEEEEHILLLNLHHIISDGWSMGVLVRELSVLYEAFVRDVPSPLEELPVQYADYAHYQREWMQGEALEDMLAFWKNELGERPTALQLPTDHPRPAGASVRGDTITFALPRELNEPLQTLCQHENATSFMVLAAAFQTLLYRLSGQTDIRIGTPVAGRDAEEVEGLIGFFVNNVVLRTDLAGTPSFREVLRRVRKSALASYQHQEIPFEMLVEQLQPERDLSVSPLFQVMFVLQNTPLANLELVGLEWSLLPLTSGTAKFDLTLSINETADGLRGELEYKTDLFERASIERMSSHFSTLLAALLQDPDRSIAEVPFLSEAERELLLVTFTDTAVAYPQDLCLHQLVERQAAQTPTAVALIAGETRLSYAELNDRANRIAHRLVALGIGPDKLVGLYMNRSADMVACLLGVLKAGAAYVPLDPNYPTERVLFTLEDANVAVLLTEERHLDRVAGHGGAILCVDQIAAELAQEKTENLRTTVQPHDLAYVIYTSGSTGRPKGVAIEHHSAATLVHWAHDTYTPDEYAGVLFSTSICFDLSIFELFVPLAGGGTVILAENALQLPELAAQNEVTLINTVPSAIAELLRLQALPANACVINLAGEPLKGSLVQALYAVPTVAKVYNLYGPTEDTTYSTYALIERDLTGQPLIGRPLPNTLTYVLSPELQPVPLGVAGELFLGGAGLARGYLNRPELTAEKFIASPFADSARLYRTGDLVRYLPDGSLDYLGRIDHQVKVRGFRIELGEIEAVLTAHPQVQEVTVIVREDQPGDQRITAYIVSSGDEQPTASDLRNSLKQKLPDYMVPSAFVMLERLPLTPNGKIDRKALPMPDLTGSASTAYIAPRTETEQRLALLWSDLLGVEQVGLHDNFFALGGHSLLATRLIARVRQQFAVDAALHELFEKPLLTEFAAYLDAIGQEESSSSQPAIQPIARTGDASLLSYSQLRMWFLDQLMPGHPVYNMPGAVRLQGSLNLTALENSLAEIIRRHEVLRATFHPALEGVEQKILEPALRLAQIDVSREPAETREQAAIKAAEEEAKRPFDLAVGPLLRTTLVKLDDLDHLLVITFHHIISDGWSIGLFVGELIALCEAFVAGQPSPLTELAVQYADFANWQHERLASDVLHNQLPYWKEQLAGELPIMQLPFDHPRPAVQSYTGRMHRFTLPAALTEQLYSLSRQEGVTLFMTLLTAFNALLHHNTGQTDLLVGSPVAGRGQPELEELIGFFVNTLVLRTDLTGNPSFLELLGRVKQTTLGAYANQDVPFEKLVEELQPARDMSHAPLFQVMFALQNAPLPEFRLSDMTLRRLDLDSGTTKFDLTLFVEEQNDVLNAAFEYNTDLFATETVERLAIQFSTLLEQIVTQPTTPIGELSLLREGQRQQLLVQWNETASGYPQLTLPQLVEAQAAQTPDQIALVYGEQRLTYEELNGRANRLAHLLQQKGIRTETLVGICLERTPQLVVAILAVLKAGGAYVPLDPNYPPERILYTLEDADVSLLITQENLTDRFAEHRGETLCIDAIGADLLAMSGANPTSDAAPHHLAYVIYTSGSTGRPKGVAIEHHSASTLVHWAKDQYTADEYAGMLFSTSICFDLSIFEMFVPLSWGGKIILAENALQLPELPARNEVTLINTVPSAIAELLRAQALPANARVLNLAGEPLNGQLVQALYAVPTVAKVYNLYGPSEDTTYSTFALVERHTVHPKIGRPLPDTLAYILNPQLQPVPIGVAGELYLGGDGLARGYLNRPDLTAERFIENPFVAGGRLYRTGDSVRYLPDGTLDYLGRIDHQVKVRGFRIELGEIEAVLLAHPQVQEATVIVREDQPGDQRITAYTVSAGDNRPSADDLRQSLKNRLPEYMVPQAIVMLDALPMTPNGKVDRKALPAPERTRADLATEFVAPRNPIEAQLATIWSELLGVAEIGVHDNFFTLGGHSLLATKLITRVRGHFQVEIKMLSLFGAATIAQLAALIESSATAPVADAAPSEPEIGFALTKRTRTAHREKK
ncbi:non-ribosomal peptide synthetase [Tumebacillus algifaecis]|nr:non-ribosomal peptide synthetase [Tumebacillus algifaecis]